MKKILIFFLAIVMLIPCVAYAASNTAGYYLVATVTSNGKKAVDSIQTYMKNMNYTVDYKNLKPASTVASGMKTANIWVLHGHGNTGYVACLQTDGSFEDISSYDRKGTAVNILTYASNAFSSTDYALYITCNSAATNNNTDSLVNVTYRKGAKAVTGFRDGVSNGEFWAKYFFEILAKGYTIDNAMAAADSTYLKEYSGGSDSPANLNNRYTRGDMDAILKLS